MATNSVPASPPEQTLLPTTGNTAATRPTKTDHIACDCCDKQTDYFNSSRCWRELAFASLPYVLCKDCCNGFGYEGPSRAQATKFIIRRAARFGIQWEEAVKALLGWPA